MRVLVVGAGFAGAVYARELAEAGCFVDVIDQRPHIGGNAHDEVFATGVRVHRYGPHLFHTSNAGVMAWLERFARFVPYQHRVQAQLPDGRTVPLPVNRATVNAVFGTRLGAPPEVAAYLRARAVPCAAPANAAEHLYAAIGRELTNLFFRPYTEKMWATTLEDLDASVVKRIPIRFDDEDRYFPDDRFQGLPEGGYAALFAAILHHPNIAVALATPFDHAMLAGYAHCFNAMPIDVFFGGVYGALPYRSLRFHHHTVLRDYARGTAAQVNFTDAGPLTRETDWARLPGHVVRPGLLRTVTTEEPCDYADNGFERYYPVKTSDGRHDAVYRRYAALAEREPGVTFIGRCGTYRYLDMHQVVNQSLAGARAWLAQAGFAQAGSARAGFARAGLAVPQTA